MDLKLIEWSKTILLAHTITPRLLSAITKENEKMMNIGFGSRHYQQGQNTYDFLDNLLKINIRRRNLTLLYQTVNEILKDTAKDERQMLEERFFYRKSVSDALPKINIRTAYRRYNQALENFSKSLLEKGYTVEILDEQFGEDRVISALFDRVHNHAIVFRSEKENEDKPHIESKVFTTFTSKMEKVNANFSSATSIGA